MLVDLSDQLGQLGVTDRAGAGLAGAAGIEGGSGDLQQFTRPFDAVTCTFLRRVSVAKKAVARSRTSTSSRSLRFSRRNAASSSRSLPVRPSLTVIDLSALPPVPHRGLGQSKAFGDPTDRAVTAPARLDNLRLELRREREARAGFFFPMLSMMDIPPGLNP
ncbi:hypothetical protein J7E99_12700 [Streptomyces sp. ISL-44]|uniref:hypothetical protein n=1 Tax=Streptomyces sp. ISL-44 TaxID=2819184 RepID=UPI001BE90230|nr:hypothetical protein [Streptomyces sp. ISL-44]MBT2541545.1 hypothetical protein [Streptomyces sp. ISL-44]